MDVVDYNILEYIRELQPLCDGKLKDVHERALKDKIPIIRKETAQFLKVLLKIHKPNRILEIGCAVGFSAALFAENINDDGIVYTIERNKKMSVKAKDNFKYMGIENKIKLFESDAIDVLPNLKEQFDFIFLDGAKGQYLRYLPYCIELLRPGGLFVSDDVLQGGYVAEDVKKTPRRNRTMVRRLDSYLHEITNSSQLETSIVPIGDGLTVSVKKEI